MKRAIAFVSAIMILSASISAYANDVPDWEEEQNLSNTPSGKSVTFGNWAKSLTTDDDGFTNAVWVEEVAQGSPGGVVLFQQIHNGTPLGSPYPISPPSPSMDIPKITSDGLHIYVAWAMKPDTNTPKKIFVRHGFRSGFRMDWDSPSVASDSSGIDARLPAIAAFGGSVHVVWVDDRAGNPEVFYSRHPNQALGNQWSPDSIVSEADGFSSWTPAISVHSNSDPNNPGAFVHVTWTDEKVNSPLQPCDPKKASCFEDVFYRRNIQNGNLNSWEDEVQITCDHDLVNRENSWAASVVASGTQVHVAYFDKRSGQFEIYYTKSPDSGAHWPSCLTPVAHISNDYPAGETIISSARPVLGVHNDEIHIVWWGELKGTAVNGINPSRVYYKYFDGFAWSSTITLTPGLNPVAKHPSISLSKDGLEVNVNWSDQRNGPVQEVYYRLKNQ